AQYELGIILNSLSIFRRDSNWRKSNCWFKRASIYRNDAQIEYARHFKNGDFFVRQSKRSQVITIKYYKMAADKLYPEGCYELGRLYADQNNYEAAFKSYLK